MSETKDNDQNEKKEEKKSLSLSDLLSYSLQVSRGMEFLASKKVHSNMLPAYVTCCIRCIDNASAFKIALIVSFCLL